MNLKRLPFNFGIGLEAIRYNRFRAFLTSLGIIFGVSAVIAMLAIGKGTEEEIAEQLKQVGSNNITINAVWKEDDVSKKEKEASTEKEEEKVKRYSPGLTIADGENILETLEEYVEFTSPEIENEVSVVRNGKRVQGKVIGITNHFFDVAVIDVADGSRFSDINFSLAEPVCIIGKSLRSKLFTDVSPIGQKIKCGSVWLTVVGVLQDKNVSAQSISSYSVRNANEEVYIPVTTMLVRFQNRAKITPSDMRSMYWDDDEDAQKPKNYHQIDKLVVKVKSTEMMMQVSEVVRKILKRRHNEVEDFDVQVPELLLKQQQKNKRQFNILLAFIASISLIVGGIGIMNIMLASVMERIKEIGLRQSLGATREDISLQFISEAVAISFTGGVIGILFGVGLCYAIEYFMDTKTIITPVSIVVSFTISIAVGLLSGITPARRASKQDPVQSLRHE
ncbi:MAG TPA: ABC transporter permease [Bacteroidia bacterium]|nr:ABC transporter permease [Bacteroidia bacterium]